MQYSFRLAELLGHVPDPRRRPGTIKAIVEYTGLDRHQVAALLKNEVKYIPLKALSRLCDYLVENGHATADDLPGSLFSIEPENFWELLARRRKLELCVGVRRENSQDSSTRSDVSFIVAADSVLLGELLNGVTTLGGTAKLKKMVENDSIPTQPVDIPQPEHFKQSLVWSPGQASPEEVIERATSIYEDFSESKGDKAFVAIGSTKSNPTVEIILARAFDCEPFKSLDGVAKPEDRPIPFFIRYRDRDPHPDSCLGGLTLSKSSKQTQPGIHFERADGIWEHFSVDNPKKEVAFVFFIHRESQGRLELVLGGFSGRATRLLARSLAMRAEDFWPPQYEMHGIQIGAFIVQYELTTTKKETDILSIDLVATSTVTRIPVDAIERRLTLGKLDVDSDPLES